MKPVDYARSGAFLFLHDDYFIDFLEMNLERMKLLSINDGFTGELTAHDRARCERNFHRVCNLLNVPYALHYYTMRLNGYTSATEYTQDRTTIVLPHVEELMKLKTLFDEYQRIT